MKKLLIGIATIIVIAAVGAGLVRYLAPDEMTRRAIERYAGDATQAAVRVDRVRISAVDGTGLISGFSVGNPAGFRAPAAITAASIRITLEKAPPAGEAIAIHTLSVASPQLTYEWSQAGSNFAKLLENIKRDTGGAPGRKFIVERLVLHAAKVSYASPTDPGRMITVDLPEDIRIGNVGLLSGGVTSREFATAIAEALIYHINRKIPASALQGGSIAPAAAGAPAGK